MKKLLFIVLATWFVGCNDDGGDANPDTENLPPAPAAISYSIQNTFPHDTSSYTQGLVIYKGELYEGTGLEGKSKLLKVDLKSGKIVKSKNLDAKYFGEGITILNDTIYQLTWQNRVVFMYSLKDFSLLKEFAIDTEGWGITTDGRELIVSDGTSNLHYYEPGTFKKLRSVSITESGALVGNVNELEYINGFIYANRYQTDQLLKIDPVTGIVVGIANFKQLGDNVRAKYPFVDYFNGIAYDASAGKIYVTGKLWPEVYEVQFGQ